MERCHTKDTKKTGEEREGERLRRGMKEGDGREERRERDGARGGKSTREKNWANENTNREKAEEEELSVYLLPELSKFLPLIMGFGIILFEVS